MTWTARGQGTPTSNGWRSTFRLISRGWFVLACLGLSVGCKKAKKETQDESTATTATASTAATAQGPTLSGEPEIVSMVEAIATNCSVDPAAGRVSGCKEREEYKLKAHLSRSKEKWTALETFVSALETNDEALQAIAASILNSSFRASLGEGAMVDGALATRLREVVVKLPNRQRNQVLPAAVHASLLADQHDQLFALLEEPDNHPLRVVGYRYLMVHGGMRVFPKVKEIVAGKEAGAAAAAAKSARSVLDASEEDNKALCEWAQEVLKDPRGSVAAEAGGLLATCGSKGVDALLAEGESRVRAKNFDAAFALAYRRLCGQISSREAAPGSDAQCRRALNLLTGVIKNSKLSSATRGAALIAAAEQWPTDATKALAVSLEKSDDKVLAARAKQALRQIESRQRRDQRIKEARAAASAAADKRTAPVAVSKPATSKPTPSPTPKPAPTAKPVSPAPPASPATP